MTVDPLVVATTLAEALDADDFDTVGALMHADVRYQLRDDTHVGPDDVVASYRAGSELAHRLFEQVDWGHEIVGLIGARTVRIDFYDGLHAGGEIHAHHSIQDIVIDEDGLVVSITDHPVEGEREAVLAFERRHGIER